MKENVSDDRDFLYFNICFTIIKESTIYTKIYYVNLDISTKKKIYESLINYNGI